MSQPSEIEPEEITRDANAREIRIVWNDGRQGRISYESLRWGCPCAACRGEMGRPGRLDLLRQTTDLSRDEMTLDSMQLVGYYAIQPFWADGHASGMYTYERLRQLDEIEATGVHGRDAIIGRSI